MEPYPTIKVKNVTTANISKYFPKAYSNFLGYRLRLPVQVDIPQTFLSTRLKDGLIYLDGVGGIIFRKFMQHINVSLEVYSLLEKNGSNYMNMSHILDMLIRNCIEISAQQYTTLNPVDVDYSYPYVITQRCFMLPLNSAIPRNLYLLLPFRWYIWLFLITFMITADLLLRIFHKCNQRRGWRTSRALGEFLKQGGVFYFMLLLMLAIPIQSLKLFRPRLATSFLFFRKLLWSYGIIFTFFYISQLYSNMLTTLLTITLFNTPEMKETDIINAKRPIMILKQEEESIFHNLKSVEKLKKLIVYGDIAEYHYNRNTFNRSYIYPISSERWDFLSMQQRFLDNKKFWYSSVCFGSFPLQYQMRTDSHFEEPLKNFIFISYESGLYYYWISNCYQRAKKLGYLHDFKNNYDEFNTSAVTETGLSLKSLSPLIYLYIIET
ncbi:uncharacterized protein LOC119676595 [Teleopsis dalmanni]|uniref:uncharacterized protein LOC119676595 n=1 Tax=Teleopsis dalmanni TaxID=139649 RepID=UPI0018CF5D75|nr:uncharacterized protein LOC119676595 [Teleopsis dalmanni]